jgi:hypothetical protein
VVLASGAVTGDLITVVSLYVSSVANGIPATSGAVVSSYLASGLTLSGTTTANTITSASGSALSLQSNGGTTAITVDTSQNVGIGYATPQGKLEVNSGTAPNIAHLLIGYSGSNNYLDANANIFRTGNYVETMRNNAYGLGLGGAIPTSGTGISFPATQSASSDANCLDDYEEGTWTPVFGSVSGSATYTAQTGTYTKIGRQVTVTFYLQVNVSSSLVSDGNVNGLPFTGSNTNYAGGALSAFNGGTFNAYCNVQTLTGAATTMQLRGTTSATQAPATVFSGGSLANGTLIAGTMTYFTS